MTRESGAGKALAPQGRSPLQRAEGVGYKRQQARRTGELEAPSALAGSVATGDSVLYICGATPHTTPQQGVGVNGGTQQRNGCYIQCHQQLLNPMSNSSSTTKAQNGQILAVQNELHILYFLHRFGWLRTRDLAAIVWSTSESTHSAISMAQRTLKRLKDSGQVLHRIAPDGATIYSPSQSGAKRLEQNYGITARSGKDLIRELGNYEHRCNANIFAINQLRAGKSVWTEREIQAGRAPIKTVLHKVPDGLVDVTEEDYKGYSLTLAWVEIERGYKKAADFNKMMHFIFSVLGPLNSEGKPLNQMYQPADKLCIGEVIVQTNANSQQNRIINAVRHGKTTAPYDYAWEYILNNLYLCTAQSADLHSIDEWVNE
uniref:Uncharacterized protein n=1 Tax=mine drainage metagenome TaxID=410659 RepID=E6QX09_9ZZZZ